MSLASSLEKAVGRLGSFDFGKAAAWEEAGGLLENLPGALLELKNRHGIQRLKDAIRRRRQRAEDEAAALRDFGRGGDIDPILIGGLSQAEAAARGMAAGEEAKETEPLLPSTSTTGIRRRGVTRTGRPSFTQDDPAADLARIRRGLAGARGALPDDPATLEGGGFEDVPLDEPPPEESPEEPSIIVKAAGAAGAAAGRVASAAKTVADVTARVRNARNAAIIGSAGVTAVIGRIIGFGWDVEEVLPDGTVIAKKPDGTQVPFPPGSAFPGSSQGQVFDVGATGQIPKRKYRTPRKGRWNAAEFSRYARAAALNTGYVGLSASTSGKDLAMQAALNQATRKASTMPVADPRKTRGLL